MHSGRRLLSPHGSLIDYFGLAFISGCGPVGQTYWIEIRYMNGSDRLRFESEQCRLDRRFLYSQLPALAANRSAPLRIPERERERERERGWEGGEAEVGYGLALLHLSLRLLVVVKALSDRFIRDKAPQ